MFQTELLKTPAYFRENRLDAHAALDTFSNRSELESDTSALRLSMNGPWKFFYAANETQVLPGFERAETDCHGWADIAVPAHISLEGYGRAAYQNVQYPWNADENIQPGEIPTRYAPIGCYVKYFTLPEAMAGRRVFIRLDGVESCVALWLNGQYIGFSSDSFTPHEFELTDALRPGENKLACRVDRFCAGSWVEDQDFLRFFGIYRDVTLYAIPKAHITDLRVVTVLDENCRRAELQITLRLTADAKVAVALKDGSRTIVKAESASENGQAYFALPVRSPKLWSSEDPYLYSLEIEVTGADGETELARQKVGFRRVEIKNSQLLINGQRVVFKGVNRHDFCAETGRAVTKEKIRRDLLLMKRNNINAVRTSHYPDTEALYDLCDELGLYVIAENNMETHGKWDEFYAGLTDRMFPGDYPEWRDLMLDRVRSTCLRDRNHPAVVLWSCGNESLTGPVILDMADEFRRLDTTRPVHYEGDCHAPAERRLRNVTDVESTMYVPAGRIREYLKTHREKPYIQCEYTHAMGNSNGAMHKYTELAYEEPLYQGGFIWDFIDQSLLIADNHGKEHFTYGGDWDDRPTDGIFCCDGIVFGDGSPSPKLQEIKYCYQNIVAKVTQKEAVVTNRAMFTNTDAYLCEAVLERDGERIAAAVLNTAVAPGQTVRYPLPFKRQAVPGEYAVTLSFRLKEDTQWAKMGYEIAFAQGTWVVAGQPAEVSGSPLRVVESLNNIGIHGDHFRVVLSRDQGLISYQFAGEEYLKQMPMLNFWRAPIDNDNGNGMPARNAQWKLASLYAGTNLTKDTRERNRAAKPVVAPDGSVSYALRFDLPTSPAACCDVTWVVHPDGTVDTRAVYCPVSGLTPPPEFGTLLSLAPALNRVRYFGLGPEENYIDRSAGARLGLFAFRVAENLTDYARPQECGNRTGVRWAEVTDLRGRGLRFTVNGGEFSALPWTPHEIENAAHAEELPAVYRTVLRINAIQMGVGGDDSWGARTHPEYLPDVTNPLDFTFSMKGFTR